MHHLLEHINQDINFACFSLVSGTTMGRSVVGNIAWISTTRRTITVLTVTSLLFQIQQWAGVWWETLHGSQLQGALSLY